MTGWLPRNLWRLRVTELVWHYDTESIEVYSVLVKAAFGAWLLGPGINAFHPPEAGLAIIARWAPERVWGVVFAFLAIIQAVFLFNGGVSGRRWVALANVFAWTFAGAVFLVTQPKISCIPFCAGLAACQFWVYLTLGIRRRLANAS